MKMKVLLVDNQFKVQTESRTKAVEDLVSNLQRIGVEVVHVKSIEDACGVARSTVWVHCVLLTRTLDEEHTASVNEEQVKFVDLVRARQRGLPVFLLCDRGRIGKVLNLELLQRINELVWLWEDSVEFIAARVKTVGLRYKDTLLPPLVSAVKNYYSKHEYSWTIPGHQGGVGLTKTPSGRAFHDFFGPHMFELDLNTSRNELGSLLDHIGPFRESEEYIAGVFGSKMSFSVVVGGSGANKTVMQACINDGANIIVDRNCHKSVEHGMILTNAHPIYMKPIQNRYGIIGPVTKKAMESVIAGDTIKKKKIPFGVLTNCTFDGICYNAVKVESILKDLPYLHFDEAWFGQARFNTLYKDLYAMRGDPSEHDEKDQTIFANHSTHKLLNGLGQGALIHVRYGKKNPVDFARFNQAYMMHTTTSPSFLIALTNDIAAQMMEGPSGQSVTQETINEAVDFRQALARAYRQITTTNTKDWFFKPWNADKLGEKWFEDVEPEKLATDQSYWKFTAADKNWHGFDDLEDDWAILDPIKVTIISPGLTDNGDIAQKGETVVPALLLSEWLLHRGIVPLRAAYFTVMFLFTMGITRGKWGTLLENLLAFKRAYDVNLSLKKALPQLTHKSYEGIGLRDLGERMASFLRTENVNKYMKDAYGNIPDIVMSPREAHDSLINDPETRQPNVEPVCVDDLMNRIVANAIVPYPPGIPLMIAGERFDEQHVQFLSGLEKWDNEFPGFELSLMGVQRDSITGKLTVQCIKKVTE